VLDMAEHLFQISIINGCQLKIELGGYEKLHVMEKLAEVHKQKMDMGKWRETAPKSEVEKYSDYYINLLASQGFLFDLMVHTGMTEEQVKHEISEILQLPF
jgi:hypothetical protein